MLIPLYFLIEPGEEMVPWNGRGAGADCVIASNCPPTVDAPVAPSKRPVPPTTSNIATLSKRPGVLVGTNSPVKMRKTLSPLAAAQVASPEYVNDVRSRTKKPGPWALPNWVGLDVRIRIEPHMGFIDSRD